MTGAQLRDAIKRCAAERNDAMAQGDPLAAEYWRGAADAYRRVLSDVS
jgi:hypothetical protein